MCSGLLVNINLKNNLISKKDSVITVLLYQSVNGSPAVWQRPNTEWTQLQGRIDFLINAIILATIGVFSKNNCLFGNFFESENDRIKACKNTVA